MRVSWFHCITSLNFDADAVALFRYYQPSKRKKTHPSRFCPFYNLHSLTIVAWILHYFLLSCLFLSRFVMAFNSFFLFFSFLLCVYTLGPLVVLWAFGEEIWSFSKGPDVFWWRRWFRDELSGNLWCREGFAHRVAFNRLEKTGEKWVPWMPPSFIQFRSRLNKENL